MATFLWVLWILGTILFVAGIIKNNPVVTAIGVGLWIAMPVTIWLTGF